MADAEERGPTLSASEVGRYIYCARAWWLQRVQGLAPENQQALHRGTQRHEAHGRALAAARRQMVWARWMMLLALILVMALLYMSLRR